MTVKELKKELKHYNDDAEVLVGNDKSVYGILFRVNNGGADKCDTVTLLANPCNKKILNEGMNSND